MAELANCANCGKLYAKTTSKICPSCYKEEEKKFEIVWRFISKRANRESTVIEVHEATGVEEKLIFRWIKEGRLLVKNFPGLSYPCSSCGTMIQSGKLCTKCSNKIQRELNNAETSNRSDAENAVYRTYKIDR